MRPSYLLTVSIRSVLCLKANAMQPANGEMKLKTITKFLQNWKLSKVNGKKRNNFTGLMDGGERICNNGETESSTKDFVDKCREIDGDIPLCHERNVSILSAKIVRCLWNGN